MKQCYGLLRELNIRKPLCPSTVPAWAIIDDHSIIVTHLTFVNNAGKDENVFAPELKKANVKPLLQIDDPMEQKNYRPISIMLHFLNFLRVFHVQITEYLDKYQRMTPFEFGFR